MTIQEEIKQEFREKFCYESYDQFTLNTSDGGVIEKWITSALQRMQSETIDKTIDWVWDGWNLDLANKDRAKKHFLSLNNL